MSTRTIASRAPLWETMRKPGLVSSGLSQVSSSIVNTFQVSSGLVNTFQVSSGLVDTFQVSFNSAFRSDAWYGDSTRLLPPSGTLHVAPGY